ncbi:unnamed protein product [Rotaria socialis]|uniref:Uncharacterized protein n=1 Tax=Rotaria socialis TaxID=392032 RepID=A0A817SH27_9BILA|nr:unnamed protein product [Rotaria socialis]CAF3314431.1 unnamed protein product [Rotaria socialis]CAF4495459.1 unnamed protein product [Rotaria socialis]CAF4776119.1 unnamed protein product [Rotaria socialis]
MPSTLTEDNRDKLKLIGAQIFFRHGARTPLNMLPNLDEVIYDKELHLDRYKPADYQIKMLLKDGEKTISEHAFIGKDNVRKLNGGIAYCGQLTAIGEKQVYDVGKKIRQNLIIKEKLLPKIYDPHLIYARSTYIDRTIHSARCFLAGLFADDDNNQTIQANCPFEIEIHSWIHEILYPNPRIYPLLEKRLKPNQLHNLLDIEDELKKARKDFLDHINLIEYEHGFIELYDDIKSREAHGFPVPNRLKQLSMKFDEYSAQEYFLTGTHEQSTLTKELFVKTTVGLMLNLIKENFDRLQNDLLTKKNDETCYKFYVYATHDTSIASMKLAFDLFDMIWPSYASYILIKLYSSIDDPTQIFVHLTFDDKEQIIPWINDYFCPYNIFIDHLKNQIDDRVIP